MVHDHVSSWCQLHLQVEASQKACPLGGHLGKSQELSDCTVTLFGFRSGPGWIPSFSGLVAMLIFFFLLPFPTVFDQLWSFSSRYQSLCKFSVNKSWSTIQTSGFLEFPTMWRIPRRKPLTLLHRPVLEAEWKEKHIPSWISLVQAPLCSIWKWREGRI